MTAPTTPPVAPTVPIYPALGSATFNSEAYTCGSSMPAVTLGIQALADNAYTNAGAAFASATDATNAALVAGDASAAAIGSANFKGLWPDLTGALPKPATVKHNGRFWLLLNNLADVTLSEPGVSADWTSLDSGRITQTVTSNTTMTPGVFYVATTPGITLTYPASMITGDTIGVQNVSGGVISVAFAGNTLMGDVQASAMSVPNLRGFETTYSGSTLA